MLVCAVLLGSQACGDDDSAQPDAAGTAAAAAGTGAAGEGASDSTAEADAATDAATPSEGTDGSAGGKPIQVADSGQALCDYGRLAGEVACEDGYTCAEHPHGVLDEEICQIPSNYQSCGFEVEVTGAFSTEASYDFDAEGNGGCGSVNGSIGATSTDKKVGAAVAFVPALEEAPEQGDRLPVRAEVREYGELDGALPEVLGIWTTAEGECTATVQQIRPWAHDERGRTLYGVELDVQCEDGTEATVPQDEPGEGTVTIVRLVMRGELKVE